jgi:5,10-methylenetetrahydromethanopterin reductase
MTPRFGFSISSGPAGPVAEESVRAEALGYDRIGIWDSPVLFREPWPVLTAAALSTSHVRLGTWVTNPVTRHPAVTAAAAATLDELAPGRVYVGIGSGGTGAWNLGLKTARLSELEHYVAALRGLLRDGSAEYRGASIRMDWPGERRIPIVVAAHGPTSLRLAGRIGDGVIVGLGVTPDVVERSLQVVEEGARESGRSLEDLEVWFTCFWFVDERPGVAAERGAWACTSFASHFARTGAEGKWVPEELEAGVLELGRAYDFEVHGSVPDAKQGEYAELAERLGVLDYLRRRFVFCGTPDEVEQQVRDAMAAGARNFDGAIDAKLPEHEERITAFGRLVLPRFAAERERPPVAAGRPECSTS